MKKQIYFSILIFTFFLLGCTNDNDTFYTQSELETFLISDCERANYIFEDVDLLYSFDFEIAPEGNIGEYHRWQLSGDKSKHHDFVWSVKPSGDGGIVTMTFKGYNARIISRLKLMDQEFYDYKINQETGETIITTRIEKLWKLDFKFKDDPF